MKTLNPRRYHGKESALQLARREFIENQHGQQGMVLATWITFWFFGVAIYVTP